MNTWNEPAAQCRLDRAQWRVELLAYFAEREPLEVGPFNDNPLHFRQFRDLLSESCVPFIRLRSVSGFPGSRRNGQIIIQESWLGSY